MSQTCASSIPDFCGAFDYCAPNFVFGEIEEIIIAQLFTEDGDPFPEAWDWEDVASWDTFLACDQDGVSNIAFRIPVRGTIDEPERPEVEASLYRKAFPPKRYTLSGSVDDLSQQAYDAMNELDGKRVRLWFRQGDYLFGSSTGLEADFTTWYVVEEGEDSMSRMAFNATWRGQAPARIYSPFADVPESDV
jgi:hypothetical protein